ncbi:4a-hydroxytetrahydrobiopterin dehydratase [Flavobacterium sp.]|jgi:4a-hydroxytetrahydrobiopterin dehydratase|uniref:4a-hydroxytetrahydrobiopterin dehydratase n=1 Tax=Flavobacterium sp. TaxID=239 RepID=UPI00333EA141
MKKNSNIEIQEAMKTLNNWILYEDKIKKQFQFKDFSEAIAFIVRIGILAEKQNHHPELHNVYNKVTIELTTHDAGGLSDKDFLLARSIDAIS